MSPLPCRIILADHASRQPLWEKLRATAPADLLTPLDPRPFAPWDVSALAAVYQVGAGPAQLTDVLPALVALRACKFRICFARSQDHVLAIIEKRERTSVDVPAMGRELLSLLDPTSSSGDDETPLYIAMPHGVSRPAPLRARANDPAIAAAPGLPPLLVVDDEMMVRSICTRILYPHFAVFEASSSHDALALADRLPFPSPLLVSDVSLPRMDGVTLADQWLKRYPDAQVLLLSGNPYPGVLRPEVHFLQKPFLADELTHIVLRMAVMSQRVAAH